MNIIFWLLQKYNLFGNKMCCLWHGLVQTELMTVISGCCFHSMFPNRGNWDKLKNDLLRIKLLQVLNIIIQ